MQLNRIIHNQPKLLFILISVTCIYHRNPQGIKYSVPNWTKKISKHLRFLYRRRRTIKRCTYNDYKWPLNLNPFKEKTIVKYIHYIQPWLQNSINHACSLLPFLRWIHMRKIILCELTVDQMHCFTASTYQILCI